MVGAADFAAFAFDTPLRVAMKRPGGLSGWAVDTFSVGNRSVSVRQRWSFLSR